ncbi:MAG: ABC-2 transporter permease [Lacrimispora sp.]
MKGLLLKDLYMAARYCRFYVAISLVFAVASIWGNNIFFMIYPVLMTTVIPVNLISYDEKSKWSVYAGTFPYSREELVSIKYVMTLIFLGIGVLMIVAAQAVKMVIYGALDWKLLGLFTAVLPFVGLTGPCIMLPAIFKFGVEKGRGIFYAVIIVVCALYGAVGAIGADSDIMVFLLTTGIWIVPAFFAAGLLLLWGSWRLSIKFYEKREL